MEKSAVGRALCVAVLSVLLGCSTTNGDDGTVIRKDGGEGSGGATGTAGSGGATGTAGSGGAGGASVSCDSYSAAAGGGCHCSLSTRAGTVAECTPDSVKSIDSGFCCGDKFLCSCNRIACVSLPNIKSCDCGIPLDSSGTRVDSCPTPTGGVCCLQKNLSQPARCHCSGYSTTCSANETVVLSCALADVKDCGPDNPVVPLCK